MSKGAVSIQRGVSKGKGRGEEVERERAVYLEVWGFEREEEGMRVRGLSVSERE